MKASVQRLTGPDPTARHIERFLLSFIGSLHKPIKKVSICLFGLFLLGMCAIRADVGFDGMSGYSHDLFVLLDGGWRVLNGQVPYNDFFTDVGTLVHLHTAFGLVLAHGRAEGLAYAQALMGCGLGLWAYMLAIRRLMPLLALLFVWTLVLFAISPSLIGNVAAEVTAACLYNRYGYVFAALLILEAFSEARASSRFSIFMGGFSSGAITALLLFIKISYFLGCGFLLAAMWPCRKQVRLRWLGVAAGFTSVFVPIWLYMHATLFPMWSSLRLLAGAKHPYLLPGTVPGATSANAQMLIVAFVALALLWQDGARAEARNLAVAVFAVVAAGTFFLLTNYQRGRVPLLPILGLLIIQQLESRFRERSRANLLMRTAILSWTCIFVVGSIALDTASLGYALGFHIQEGEIQNFRFDSPRLSGFRDLETWYVALVNDGISLLQKYRQPSESVASLDFSNPFSYALGIAPPWGGTPTGLQYRTNFDERHKLPPEFLIGHASLVMVPNTFTDITLQETVPRIYGPYLESHFHLVSQTSAWRLYRTNAR